MKTITLDILENALSPISSLGKNEITFEINGISVSLRVLLPEEESSCHRYALEALPDSDNKSTPEVLDYLERFKLSILSHAICQVGDLDLRGVEFIETGEKLENGTVIKQPKYLAIRDLLKSWTQEARTIAFSKYNELISDSEQELEEELDYNPVDIDTEIDRLEKKIQVLKDSKLKLQAPLEMKKQTQNFVETTTQNDSEKKDVLQRLSEKPYAHNAASPPPSLKEKPVEEQEQPSGPIWQDGDSFINSGDVDAMNKAIVEENKRLMAMRAGKQEPSYSVLDNARKPPHIQAQEVSDKIRNSKEIVVTNKPDFKNLKIDEPDTSINPRFVKAKQ